MSNQADAVQNGGRILVRFDPDNRPVRVTELEDALDALQSSLESIRVQMVSPMDVREVEDLAEWLQIKAAEVASVAGELYLASKAANGLAVTTEANAG